MKKITCESYERGFLEFTKGTLDPEHRKAFEDHREQCEHCRNFSKATSDVRVALSQLPAIETPPYFTSNLKREINRLEQGSKKPEWNSRLIPRLLALGTGFALALFISFVALQPGQQPGIPGMEQPDMVAGSGASEETVNPDKKLTIDRGGELLLTENEVVVDTMTHRLPEPAGMDSIPIPVDDDYWKINQVSTTPEDN